MILTTATLVLLFCQEGTIQFAGKLDVDLSEQDFDVRRLRLGVKGTFDEGPNYALSFNNNVDEVTSELHEALISFDHSFGEVELGYFKEPFGLDNSSSSHEVSFLERSSATLLNADHNIGFAANSPLGSNAYLKWGVFRNAVSARFTNLLIDNEDQNYFWHVGASAGSRTSDKYFAGDNIALFDVETLFQDGAFSFQAEAQSLEADNTESVAFSLQASIMLAGEDRVYSISKGSFRALETPGALEFAVRSTRVDMSEYSPEMNVINDYNAALNYCIDDSSKLQLEIGHGSDGFTEDETTVILRYHFRW
ncbi:MAG: porin [Planctomycetota bacterium]|nr:porin [Planctomycetota bacterium]